MINFLSYLYLSEFYSLGARQLKPALLMAVFSTEFEGALYKLSLAININ